MEVRRHCDGDLSDLLGRTGWEFEVIVGVWWQNIEVSF
jgi:hypothetical protein